MTTRKQVKRNIYWAIVHTRNPNDIHSVHHNELWAKKKLAGYALPQLCSIIPVHILPIPKKGKKA